MGLAVWKEHGLNGECDLSRPLGLSYATRFGLLSQ